MYELHLELQLFPEVLNTASDLIYRRMCTLLQEKVF